MKEAAVGFRVHSGWTTAVAVTVEKGFPSVVAKQRPHLVETFSYAFRQPYHTAEKMALPEAREFVARVQERRRGVLRIAQFVACNPIRKSRASRSRVVVCCSPPEGRFQVLKRFLRRMP